MHTREIGGKLSLLKRAIEHVFVRDSKFAPGFQSHRCLPELAFTRRAFYATHHAPCLLVCAYGAKVFGQNSASNTWSAVHGHAWGKTAARICVSPIARRRASGYSSVRRVETWRRKLGLSRSSRASWLRCSTIVSYQLWLLSRCSG